MAAAKSTSPMTGEPLPHKTLTPNHVVSGLCRRFSKENQSL